ncbi:MAG: SCO family protein [Alphaproteobacteria bacterium]|nr:SCO family protein [Alphaproteobacteria bacterium]
MKRSIKISLSIAAIGLIALIILLLGELNRRAAPPENRLTADIGGAFSLIDQNGNKRSDADFAGRPMLIYFGFTYCPDVCPTSLDLMGAALDILAEKNPDVFARLQPVFISVDPARDTPPVLRDYLAYFHPRLVGLTGSEADIIAVKTTYKIYAARRSDSDENGNYNVDHSSFFYLMDENNRYLAHFDHAVPAEKLAEKLAQKLN